MNFISKAICLFLLIISNCIFAKNHFYYSPDGKQKLDLATDKIIIKFSDNLSFLEKKGLLKNENVLDIFTKEMELPAPDISIVTLRNKVSSVELENILERLETKKEIQYATPFLIYEDGTYQGVWEEFLVKIKSESDFAKLANLAKIHNVEILAENEFQPNLYTLVADKNSNGNALELANKFYETGLFEYSEPNFLLRLEKFTNDTFYGNQWSIENTGTNTSTWNGINDADMDVDLAWNITTGSSSIKVAILDEGVDLVHPDLVGNLLAGYDATGQGSNGAPSNDDAHGTACAGIVAATANNSIGVAGVAYSCKIIPVRIAYDDGSGWVTTNSWIGNAINWAWQTANADILSNSWGGGGSSSTINSAISGAVNNGRSGLGSPVLFAAGNDNSSLDYPGNLSDVISVAAMSMCNERKSPSSCDNESWWGSNYGTNLDIAAPGVKIYATDISGSNGYSSGDYISNFNGTSSACPNAAGVMALILSADPTLTESQARFAIESTCDKVGGYSYNTNGNQPNGTWSSELGYGRVNAMSAVQLVSIPTTVVMNSAISVTPNLLEVGQPVNASVLVQNTDSQIWTGNFYLALHDANGNFISDLDVINNQVLASGATQTLNFSNSNISSQGGQFSLYLKYETSSNGQFLLVPPNGFTNPLPINISVGCVTSYPYSQNFDTFSEPLTLSADGWENVSGDDFDWTVNSGTTVSSGTGPNGDNTSGSGNYLYTESSNPNFPSKIAYLISPCFDLTSLSSPELKFWYHLYGVDMGSLNIDVFDVSTSTYTNSVFTLTGQQQTSNSDAWQEATVDLSTFVGNEIRLRFRGTTGLSYTSDICIDDFSIDDSNTIPPSISVSPNSVIESLQIGQTSNQNITVSNTMIGSSDLTFIASLQNVTFTSPQSSKGNSSISNTIPTLPKGSSSMKGTGNPQINSVGGPDTFGYSWEDSNEPNGPVYSWTDISGTGTLATFTAISSYNAKDEGISQIPIGFNFDFYGNSYSNVYVGTNGFISFDSFTGNTWTNQVLPNSSVPNNLIAGFWDDLDGSSQGDVFYETIGNDLIIQFENWPDYGSTTGNTFQFVLNSNGNIKIQYESMTGATTSCSVGIEDSGGTDGLSVVNNASYVTDLLAVEFSSSTQNPNWIALSPTSGTVSANGSTNLSLDFDATNLTSGTFTGDLQIDSNDPITPILTIPISLVVGGNQAPIADAGTDQNLTEGVQVTLDGSGSSDFENDPITYLWTQISGTSASLNSNSAMTPTFTAPEINGSEILAFILVVNDGTINSLSDTVEITVNDKLPLISLSQNSISENLTTGQTSSQIIGITNSNTGSSDLTYTAILENYSVSSPTLSKKNTSQISSVKLPKGNISVAGTGTPQTNSSGGPDTFGYEWKDSNETNGPAYNWTDISTTGTLATNWIAVSTYDGKDEGYAFVPIGFTFDFYGNSYNDVYIGSNGFLTFDIFSGDTFTNQSLPSNLIPDNLIAGYWDDLDGSSQGDVFYETNGNEFVVQFDNWPQYLSTDGKTFQIILSSDGKVKIQYENMLGLLTGGVVGIENSDGTDGLEVVENASYVANNLAVEFYPPTQTSNWLTLSQSGGTVSALTTENLTLNFDATNLTNGNYSVDLVVNSDDTTNSSITIPITLVIAPTLGQMTQVFISESNTNVTLNWISVTGANLYKIYRSTNPELGFTEVGTSVNNSWTDINVGSNTIYFYKVTAND